MIDVVRKLIGPIDPTGEIKEDDKRLENLQEMTMVVDFLVGDIDRVACRKVETQDTVSRAGKYADNFLTELGIEE